MWLQGAWEAARDNGMVNGLLVMGCYMGVLGLWHGGSGRSSESQSPFYFN